MYSYDAGKGYAMKLVAGHTLAEVLDKAQAQREAGELDEDQSPSDQRQTQIHAIRLAVRRACLARWGTSIHFRG